MPPKAWTCPDCETENELGAETCDGCGEDAPAVNTTVEADDEDDRFKNTYVAHVLAVEPVTGKDNLKVVQLDLGAVNEGKPLQVVTNAKNVVPEVRVVVACIGAMIGETEVKKTQVGGVVSHGMLCDPPMLGWVGGGAGAAVLLPPSFAPGTKPPESRPRGDGK